MKRHQFITLIGGGGCRMGKPGSRPSVVNLKSAQELGITIPPSVLACADEVIE